MAVRVQIDDRVRDEASGVSLFECADRLGVHVPTSCVRQGKCRECLVEVQSGDELLSARSPEEEHLQDGFRLACRARVAAANGTIVCHTMRRGELRIEASGTGCGEVDPVDAAVQRSGTDVVRAGEVIATNVERLLGLALDVGTTTVVVRLVDLESGLVLATQSFENPQRFGGSEVMARILYDDQHAGRLLQRTLLAYLAHAIDELPCEPDEIFDVCVVGNSTMRDLLFGLNVHSIGQRPYRSLTEEAWRAGESATTSLDLLARKLRLPVHASAHVYGAPLVSGHVGADAAAGVLATGIARAEGLSVLMDIGTNTELVVGNRDRLVAASCPAGPAFEGGGVTCGMSAFAGAIERARARADGGFDCEVIGGGAASGICGSGLVDVLGELVRTGRMNSRGRFEDELQRVVLDAEHGIFFEERDVNELAQAKGANVAGLRALLATVGARIDDVERLWLAGGFARHIELGAARRIGLVPNLPDERIERVGNVAIEGAMRLLLSQSARSELDRTVQGIEHVELELHEDFFDFFVDGCQFMPVEDACEA